MDTIAIAKLYHNRLTKFAVIAVSLISYSLCSLCLELMLFLLQPQPLESTYSEVQEKIDSDSYSYAVISGEVDPTLPEQRPYDPNRVQRNNDGQLNFITFYIL